MQALISMRSIIYFLICEIIGKNFLPINKKIRRKNQISKKRTFNFIGTIKIIQDQSIKNFLILQDIEEENYKI